VRASLHDVAHELEAREMPRPGPGRGRRIAAVARIRPSHPGDGVEWSESVSHIVRIGACVDQSDRELEMAVHHREHQWTGARNGAAPPIDGSGGVFSGLRGTLHRRIHIAALLEKLAHRVEVTLTHGKAERREPGIARRLDGGSSPD